MNRRNFLNLLATATGVATLDPERLLWKPTKTIFIPKPIERHVTATEIMQGQELFDREYTRLSEYAREVTRRDWEMVLRVAKHDLERINAERLWKSTTLRQSNLSTYGPM